MGRLPCGCQNGRADPVGGPGGERCAVDEHDSEPGGGGDRWGAGPAGGHDDGDVRSVKCTGGASELLHVRAADGAVGAQAFALDDDTSARGAVRGDVRAEITGSTADLNAGEPGPAHQRREPVLELWTSQPVGRRDAACQFCPPAPVGISACLAYPYGAGQDDEDHEHRDGELCWAASSALDEECESDGGGNDDGQSAVHQRFRPVGEAVYTPPATPISAAGPAPRVGCSSWAVTRGSAATWCG